MCASVYVYTLNYIIIACLVDLQIKFGYSIKIKVGLSAILIFDFRFKSWGYLTIEDPRVNGSPGKDFVYTFLVMCLPDTSSIY
jgi:hypothetical protein